ncbi:MAG TPA: TauD/TfdA family dioxygenase [Stellaceae bacterium]|jgi:alpha-ketoglutarate-dependent 2,4-dichlorophenoxyacetate dioxygenase|nr:TauD/TfdA family dioxygenase [Stellaceae bacterium]
MPLAAQPLHPLFAARITGLDPRRPLTPEQRAEAIALMDRYAVCVYPNAEPLSNDEHIAFSHSFGPMQRGRVLTVTGRKERLEAWPELVDVGNLDIDGRIREANSRARAFNNANRLWHTDMSFHPNRATYSLLNAHIVPAGEGDTEFADLRAAYDALPDTMKARLDGLVASHSIWYSRMLSGFPEPTEEELRSRPPAEHRIVQVHPTSGRKTLYLASHASHILSLPEAEGRTLLKELTEFATQRQFIYRHRWTKGDIVIWDNRCTMHRATPFDDLKYPRDMRRTTCREHAVTEAFMH